MIFHSSIKVGEIKMFDCVMCIYVQLKRNQVLSYYPKRAQRVEEMKEFELQWVSKESSTLST